MQHAAVCKRSKKCNLVPLHITNSTSAINTIKQTMHKWQKKRRTLNMYVERGDRQLYKHPKLQGGHP